MVLPRTRTSRVPFEVGVSSWLVTGKSYVCWTGLVLGDGAGPGGRIYVPSLASSKQCLGSQWLVKMTTLWPLFCSPTAASTTNLSAPPMPRSGWKKTIVFFFFSVAVVSAILPWSWLSLAFPCVLGTRGHVSTFQYCDRCELATPSRTYTCHGSPRMTKPLIRTSTSRWQQTHVRPHTSTCSQSARGRIQSVTQHNTTAATAYHHRCVTFLYERCH